MCACVYKKNSVCICTRVLSRIILDSTDRQKREKESERASVMDKLRGCLQQCVKH